MNREILRLAIPNIITSLTVPLLGAVDLVLMGHAPSPRFIGAVSLGGAIFSLVYWNFAFLRMSVTGLTAQALGRDSVEASARLLFQGVFVALLGGLLILLLQTPIEQLAFWLLDGSPEVKDLAKNYYRVRIWAAPAAILLLPMTGWMLGMQNARDPMWIAVLINLVNLGSSFALVRYGGLLERGVALGSVIAQYFGLILAITLLFRNYRAHLLTFKLTLLLQLRELLDFGKVSSDIFIRTGLVLAVFTFFTSESGSYGDIPLAANSVLIQFLFLFSYFVDGFSTAAEAIVGRVFGERSGKRLRRVSRLLFLWGFGFALLFSATYLVFGDLVVSLFTDRPEVRAYARGYSPMAALIPLVGFGAYIWDGIFIGATASRAMRNTMLFATLICFFFPYFALKDALGNTALWLSMLLYMSGRTLSQTVIAKRCVYSHF